MKGVDIIKFKTIVAACALGFVLLQGNANAYEQTEKINWFFRSNGSEQPLILDGSDIAKQWDALYLGPDGDKTVYLTFDAGYSNENVETTLEILAKHNAKAAFFILPGIIKNNPEVVKRMADDGHFVCNHSTSHGDMSKITDINQFKAELEGVETLYRETTGFEMEKYFRPPEGSFSPKTLEFCKDLGYTPVFWSFAYADWDNSKQPDCDAARNKILNSTHDGMVLLLHPTSETNALILDSVLTELSARGYCFGTLDDLYDKVITTK